MRTINIGVMASALAAASASAQSPTNFPAGITLGPSGTPHAYFDSWSWSSGSKTSTEIYSEQGGLVFYSGTPGTNPLSDFAGGIALSGKPLSFVLGSDFGANSATGTFDVWRKTDFWETTSGSPVFTIDTAANTASFRTLNVQISNGTLTVGGSPVITEATAPTVLGGQGFLQTSGLSSALASATPPTASAAWTNAFVPRGTISNGGSLALGASTASNLNSFASGSTGAVASGQYSFATGYSSTASGNESVSFGGTASGLRSFSHGFNNTASGTNSLASGFNNTASGTGSFVRGAASSVTSAWGAGFGASNSVSGNYGFTAGVGNQVTTYNETVFGGWNAPSGSTNTATWSETDPLFSLGNGDTSSSRSNAMMTLKNGQTTLTNKAWLANTGNPLADPGTTSDGDSGGEALVVDGHTRLRGKVVIEQPQGDISMGIYE